MSKFNILYWNINFRTLGTTESVAKASEIVVNTLNKYMMIYNNQIHAIILTEAYPQINEQLNYNHIDISIIKKELEKKEYIVNPYDINYYDETLINEIKNENLTNIDFKKNFMTKNGFIPFKTYRYENAILIACKKDFEFKVVNYNCINPNYLCLYSKKLDLILAGTRICIGNYGKMKKTEASLVLDTLMGKFSQDNSLDYCLENLSDDDEYINDNCVRRGQYEYIKKNICMSDAKNKIVIGDFNIDKEFTRKGLWCFSEIVSDKEFTLVTTKKPTIGNGNKDYLYTPNTIDKFEVVEEMKDLYSINTDIVNFQVKAPFPDHNLLFASIEV